MNQQDESDPNVTKRSIDIDSMDPDVIKNAIYQLSIPVYYKIFSEQPKALLGNTYETVYINNDYNTLQNKIL